MGRSIKVPDGTRMNSRGVLIEKKGLSQRLYWGPAKVQDFRRCFPFSTNEDLAVQFGCSVRTVVRRAREMRLQKDPQWLHSVWEENRRLAHFVNKLPSTRKADLTNFLEAGRRTRFKPGEGYILQLTPEQRLERSRKSWETRRRLYGPTGARTKGKYTNNDDKQETAPRGMAEI